MGLMEIFKFFDPFLAQNISIAQWPTLGFWAKIIYDVDDETEWVGIGMCSFTKTKFETFLLMLLLLPLLLSLSLLSLLSSTSLLLLFSFILLWLLLLILWLIFVLLLLLLLFLTLYFIGRGRLFAWFSGDLFQRGQRMPDRGRSAVAGIFVRDQVIQIRIVL